MDKVSSIFKKILPIYWAFLSYMLLKPGTENHEYWFMFAGLDKVIHFSIFAALGFCFRAVFYKMQIGYFLLIMLLYALLTEFLQWAMQLGRSAEALDILADMVGVVIGFWIYSLMVKRFL